MLLDQKCQKLLGLMLMLIEICEVNALSILFLHLHHFCNSINMMTLLGRQSVDFTYELDFRESSEMSSSKSYLVWSRVSGKEQSYAFGCGLLLLCFVVRIYFCCP